MLICLEIMLHFKYFQIDKKSKRKRKSKLKVSFIKPISLLKAPFKKKKTNLVSNLGFFKVY